MPKEGVFEGGPEQVKNVSERNIDGGRVLASMGAEMERGNVKEVCLQEVHGLDGSVVWCVSLKRGDGRENGGMVDEVLVRQDSQ